MLALGSLTVAMRARGLLPVPAGTPYAGLSFEDVALGLRSARAPILCELLAAERRVVRVKMSGLAEEGEGARQGVEEEEGGGKDCVGWAQPVEEVLEREERGLQGLEL